MPTSTFLPSVDELKSDVRLRCEELSKDIHNLLPSWARQEADEIFKKRKLIVCGTVCHSELRVLARNAQVIGIVDPSIHGALYDIPVISTDTWIDWAKQDKSIVSCILTTQGNEFRFFMQRCMEWDLPFLDPLHLLYLINRHAFDVRFEVGLFFMYGYDFFDFTLRNSARLLELCNVFDDVFSRFSWLCMLMYRLTYNPYYLDACCVGMNCGHFGLDTYEINRRFFQFSDQEVYVDGGCHVGYMIECFLNAVRGKFKHIYAFEPLGSHVREIRQRLNRLQGLYLDQLENRITIIEKGLWNKEGSLRFITSQTHQTTASFGVDINVSGGAHFVETDMNTHLHSTRIEGGVDLSVTSIDASTNGDATFLKLEVEGAELQALHGATQTITRNRPLIALGMYHKPDDYVTLTDFILNTGLGYKLGFRHHDRDAPRSAVMYCYHGDGRRA